MVKDEKEKKFKMNFCVIAFQRSDDRNMFEQEFENCISDLKN